MGCVLRAHEIAHTIDGGHHVKVFITAILSLVIVLPINLWLQYQVLKRVDASELMWFLYWVNVPVLILMHVITRLLEKQK